MDAKDIRLGVLSAIGGSFLTIGGQVAVEMFKARQAESVKAAEAIVAKVAAESGELQKLSDAFGALGDTPRRAAEYVETGKGGSLDDVRVVVRNLGHVIRIVAAGRASREQLQKVYGGMLAGWGTRLTAIADGSAPVSDKFSRIERYNLTFLGAALSTMSVPAEGQMGMDPISDYSQMSNDSMMMNDMTENAM